MPRSSLVFVFLRAGSSFSVSSRRLARLTPYALPRTNLTSLRSKHAGHAFSAVPCPPFHRVPSFPLSAHAASLLCHRVSVPCHSQQHRRGELPPQKRTSILHSSLPGQLTGWFA